MHLYVFFEKINHNFSSHDGSLSNLGESIDIPPDLKTIRHRDLNFDFFRKICRDTIYCYKDYFLVFKLIKIYKILMCLSLWAIMMIVLDKEQYYNRCLSSEAIKKQINSLNLQTDSEFLDPRYNYYPRYYY